MIAARGRGRSIAIMQHPPDDREDDHDDDLVRAARAGDWDAAEQLLNQGAENVGPALVAAVQAGRLATAQLLLDRSIGVVGRRTTWTFVFGALVEACRFGAGDIVEAILEHVSRHHSRSDREPLEHFLSIQRGAGPSPLAMAARAGHLSVVELLLGHPVDVNEISGAGTALQMACLGQQHDVVELLVEHGARINACVRPAPLHIATTAGDSKLVALLVSLGAEVDRQCGCGFTALMTAVRAGRADLVELLLLDGGADTEARGYCGETALLLACRDAATLGIAAMLLERGACVSDRRALVLACSNQNVACVELLLGFGAAVHEPVPGKQSALSTAVCLGDKALVHLLLRHSDDTGRTTGSVIGYCVRTCNAPMALYLLRGGGSMPPDASRAELELLNDWLLAGYKQKHAECERLTYGIPHMLASASGFRAKP